MINDECSDQLTFNVSYKSSKQTIEYTKLIEELIISITLIIMKWSLVFLVLAGVCAVVNADCCQCEADQNDITVRTEGKVVSVTVNPERY